MNTKLDEISKLTGVKRAEMIEMFQKVKANSAVLEECAGPHVFVGDANTNPLRVKYTCSKCGGTVDGIARQWYQRGLNHGRK